MSEQASNPVTEVLEATQRLLAGLESLTDEDLRAASDLPGWTKGHIVAHLALNAHGLAGALRAARTGEGSTAVYASDESRDADIERLSVASADELRQHNQMASLRLAGELRLMKALVQVERRPGGPVLTAPDVVELRWREVEIHHADLGIGYSPADWSPAFAEYLVHQGADARKDDFSFTMHVSDLGKTVIVGQGGHGIAGTAAALGWWLVGRGTGEGLVSARPLPELGRWR